jgi:hypothetical protein
LSGGTENSSESASSGEILRESGNVVTPTNAVEPTRVSTPADVEPTSVSTLTDVQATSVSTPGDVEPTSVSTLADVQRDNDETTTDVVRGDDAIESVEPVPILVPSRSDAHVPENFAASLASSPLGERPNDNASPTDAVRDTAGEDESQANLHDRAEEDVDIPLREDLRAFRQSLGQQRQTAIGPLVIGAVALLAIAIGAYWYKAEVSVGSGPDDVAVEQSVDGPTYSGAKRAAASTTDVGANSASTVSSGRAEPSSRTASNRTENSAAGESAKSTATDEVTSAPSTASAPTTASAADSARRSTETAKASTSRSARTTRAAAGSNAPARVSNRRPNASAPAVATASPPSDADAAATERLIARDLGRFAPTLPPSNRTSDRASADTRDRDAIETQRLVDRDLGAFRGAQRSLPDRAFPEIN